MGRRVISSAATAAGTNQGSTVNGDEYLGRLVKYIPSEIIALYVAVAGVIPTPPNNTDKAASVTHVALWWNFFLCLLLTPIYIWWATRNPNRMFPTVQITLSTIAFAVWVFALGGPFEHMRPGYVASIVLMFVTFVFGMIKPNQGA